MGYHFTATAKHGRTTGGHPFSFRGVKPRPARFAPGGESSLDEYRLRGVPSDYVGRERHVG